jgi:hypothetical protein
MLLLYAQTKVEPQDLDAFQEFYFMQLPKKVNVEGYMFGHRYQNIKDPTNFITLYGIRHKSYLERLLSQEIEKRDAILQNLAKMKRDFILQEVRLGVYELKKEMPPKVPFLKDNSYLTIELWNWSPSIAKEQVEQAFDKHYVDEVLNYPDHYAAYRFEQLEHKSIDYTNNAEKNLLLVEYMPILGVSVQKSYELNAKRKKIVEGHSIELFRPIAKHWKIT